MDKEHKHLVDKFFEKISIKANEIANGRFKMIQSEFEITHMNLGQEDQLEFWKTWHKSEIEKARGDFNITIKKFDRDSFTESYSKPSFKDYLEEKNALPHDQKEQFILERAHHYADSLVIEKIRHEMELLSNSARDLKEKLEWTGAPIELVQIIYGMHEAGKINDGKGDITKILNAIALLFNINTKTMLSNHSRNLHTVSSSYQPAIFKKIEVAYCNFSVQAPFKLDRYFSLQ
jgi:hypothetical protein